METTAADTGAYTPKPSWLKTKIPSGADFALISRELREKSLNTVCREAACPNISECWQARTSTFMILGDVCTRNCLFCNVKTAVLNGGTDKDEPIRLAETIYSLGIKYAVITMVSRDDLEDGGASHVAEVLKAIRKRAPQTNIEFLGSDFSGNESSIKTVLSQVPKVFAHNVETVERLTPIVRDGRADYRVSLEVLRMAKRLADYPVFTKSGLIVGLSETFEEIVTTLKELREASVDFVTVGQYLRPSMANVTVSRYLHPDEFKEIENVARDLGFLSVASAPLVRSSYRAREFFENSIK
ncbi:MAG: lipoyl synthase [Oligoflexales bacterium]|nr:lipoyl synthase [Oligoflexales bacterium]